MSERVSLAVNAAVSRPGGAGPISGRFFIVGQTQKGRADAPVIINSIASYEAAFGPRTGGTAMYDAAALALRCGAGEIVVQRAVGPAPVAASASLDSGKLLVTALEVGAHANTWTAAYTAATKTLTIVAGSVTETYTGADAAALVAAAAYSPRVAVTTSGTLPAANVTAVTLSGGTDDFANVAWANQLAKIPADLGSGSISIPGQTHATVGAALAAHCVANARTGLVVAAAGTNVAGLASAAGTAAGYTGGSALVTVGPWVKVPDGAGGKRTVDPTGYAAALRAAAQRVGPGESAAALEYARGIVDVTPEFETTAADWATLSAAGVSVIRTYAAQVRLFNYRLAAPLVGNPNLTQAGYRDLVNYISAQCDVIADRHANHPGDSGRIAAIVAEITALLSGLSGRYLAARVGADGSQVDPGFRVEVNTGQAADGRWTVTIALRLTEGVEFFDVTIAVGDSTYTL